MKKIKIDSLNCRTRSNIKQERLEDDYKMEFLKSDHYVDLNAPIEARVLDYEYP